MNNVFNVAMQSDYSVLALAEDGFNGYTAVVKRNTDVEPYVVAFGYDITDGTWAAGHYHQVFNEAMKDFGKSLG